MYVYRSFVYDSGSGLPACSLATRKAGLREACQRNSNNLTRRHIDALTIGDYRHIVIDEGHKVLYCFVPKAACSSWKYVIAIQSGHTSLEKLLSNGGKIHSVEYASGIRRLHKLYNLTTIQEIIRSEAYTRMIIARNPYSRLHSGYNDKIIQMYREYGRGIVRANRQFYPELPEVNGNILLPFANFVDLIIRGRLETNEHFRSINNLCHPCVIDYDYIAKTETMDTDKLPLLALFNATSLPSVNTAGSKAQNIFNVSKVSMEESYAPLADTTMRDFAQAVRLDLELFGYGDPTVGDKEGVRVRAANSECRR